MNTETCLMPNQVTGQLTLLCQLIIRQQLSRGSSGYRLSHSLPPKNLYMEMQGNRNWDLLGAMQVLREMALAWTTSGLKATV